MASRHYVTGPGGLLERSRLALLRLIRLDTACCSTLAVVALILIVVYRSPSLWIIPLAYRRSSRSRQAGGIVYLLAKQMTSLTWMDSRREFSPFLVIGAATDYALLLIARYREELHQHENRFDAMRAAYKGVWEPIHRIRLNGISYLAPGPSLQPINPQYSGSWTCRCNWNRLLHDYDSDPVACFSVGIWPLDFLPRRP
jgi:hypothetical protein